MPRLRCSCSTMFWIDWLIIHFFMSRSRIRYHHYRWRAAKFRPMFGAQGLWAGRGLYRATPAVIWDLGFSGLIEGLPYLVTSNNTQGDVENMF
jgi:hypothetical protein